MIEDLYPHQRKAVEELGNGKVLCGGVGVGKSRTAMRYYVEREGSRDIYIITTAKKRDSLDWLSEAARYGVGTRKDASRFGVLTVESWNNISKFQGVSGAFFIFDEQRLVGSGAWVKSFLKIAKKNRWIMLSATPGDTWLDYIPLFVANGLYANRTEFKDQHVVYDPYSKFPRVKGYIGVSRLLRHRDSLLVDMPYVRATTRHEERVGVDYPRELFDDIVKRRWNVFEDRPLRSPSEFYQCIRRATNSDPSRLAAIRKLLQSHPRLIVFYNFDYELAILRTLAGPEAHLGGTAWPDTNSISTEKFDGSETQSATSLKASSQHATSGSTKSVERSNAGKVSAPDSRTSSETVTLAEWNGHKHEPVPDTDRWMYLVQYSAGAEAWNCVTTNAVAYYSLQYSYRILEQTMGRIDRLDTRHLDLYYYSLVSKAPIDSSIARALGRKQSFNETRGLKDFGISASELVSESSLSAEGFSDPSL